MKHKQELLTQGLQNLSNGKKGKPLVTEFLGSITLLSQTVRHDEQVLGVETTMEALVLLFVGLSSACAALARSLNQILHSTGRSRHL